MFSNSEEEDYNKLKELELEKEEIRINEAILNIKNKYGKNSLIKVMDLQEYATARLRNEQVGGHKG